MPNFVKISFQIKKFFMQARDSDRSVCMAAICYSGPISAVSTYYQLFVKKRTCDELQIDISKTERLVR